MKRIAAISSILLSSVFGSAGLSAALAADMDYPIRGPVYHQQQTDVEYGSGWYLRGDVGYHISADTTLSFVSDARYDYDNQSFDHNYSWGGGFGYTFNEMLRADVTIEMSGNHEWEGSTTGTLCGTVPGDCYSEDKAVFDRTTVLANGYVSLGRFAGFSPYVGGGVGLTHVAWSDYSSQAYCTVDPGEDCTYGSHSGATTEPETYAGPETEYDEETGVALTYALTAGFDYRINKNWLFDAGYKWTHINGGIVISENSGGVGNPQGDSKFDSINLHEVKFGLRYEVW